METEVAATFYNAKEALPFRITLEEMGHPQPPTPMEFNNETALVFLLDTMKLKRAKAIDMIFHWVKDRIKQNQFLIYWRLGKENCADYVSKHHSAAHHQLWRPFFSCLVHNNITPTEKCLKTLYICLQSRV